MLRALIAAPMLQVIGRHQGLADHAAAAHAPILQFDAAVQ